MLLVVVIGECLVDILDYKKDAFICSHCNVHLRIYCNKAFQTVENLSKHQEDLRKTLVL